MAVGRIERRASREARVREDFGERATVALDLLELTELAWHDCYGEVTPPDEVIADILTCANGDMATLVTAARLAVEDFRDLRIWATDVARGSDA
jgi:uncharacterized protein with von Willebrand factor type A (vWA) domain